MPKINNSKAMSDAFEQASNNTLSQSQKRIEKEGFNPHKRSDLNKAMKEAKKADKFLKISKALRP